MSFQQGLSGLNASSKNLEVIGNNIANANTYGAKASRAEFADVYAAPSTAVAPTPSASA
jgi:flagellar hook protein FlgE